MENINDITASKRAFYLEYFKYIFLTILAYMYFSYIFNAGDSLSLSLSLSFSLSLPLKLSMVLKRSTHWSARGGRWLINAIYSLSALTSLFRGAPTPPAPCRWFRAEQCSAVILTLPQHKQSHFEIIKWPLPPLPPEQPGAPLSVSWLWAAGGFLPWTDGWGAYPPPTSVPQRPRQPQI